MIGSIIINKFTISLFEKLKLPFIFSLNIVSVKFNSYTFSQSNHFHYCTNSLDFSFS
jgi:hypothetical protein